MVKSLISHFISKLKEQPIRPAACAPVHCSFEYRACLNAINRKARHG